MYEPKADVSIIKIRWNTGHIQKYFITCTILCFRFITSIVFTILLFIKCAPVPATMPDDIVAIAGLPLEVTLDKGLKSSPSLAMAKSTRGIGNMEPSRLERQTTK